MLRTFGFALGGGIILTLILFGTHMTDQVARGDIILGFTADYIVATPTVTADTALDIPGGGENRTVSVLVSNAGPDLAKAAVTITGSAPSGCSATPGAYSGTGVDGSGGMDPSLSAGGSTTVSRPFTINCTAPGNKTFIYSASVSVLADQGGGNTGGDPDTSSNGPKTVQQTVTVTGIVDLAVTAPTVTPPGSAPPPGSDFSVTVATSASNSGFSPANADLTLGLTQVAAADCTITPGVQVPANPISLGAITGVSRDFTVNCSLVGDHTLRGSAEIALVPTANVSENNTANNGPLTTDEIIPDVDGDGVPDSGDNCPAWPNSDQSLPPWPVTLDGSDPDCDGTTTALENFLGTDPFDACGPNAWPPDTNDNGTVNAGDFGIIVDSWQKSSGEQGYIQRADLNGNGTVNAGDLGPIAETWQLSCT